MATSAPTTPSASSSMRPPGPSSSTPTASRSSEPYAPPGAVSGLSPVFPPLRLLESLAEATVEILHELLPERRLRSAPRVVKRKMSNFGVKRGIHHCWPQPCLRPEAAVRILAAP
jgi:hypothetical protein